MTRIIGGRAKGRRLAVPKQGTRPTSDQAREGLFNTLGGLLDLDGARVLDLFAGSGAVGLEALSRGAHQVVFVESGRAAGAVLHRNIDTVGLPDAQAYRRPVEGVLAGVASEAFDLVFADPPYAYEDERLAELLAALVTRRWLTEDAVVVVERSVRSAEPAWPAGIALVTQRRYGEAALWYGRAQHGH